MKRIFTNKHGQRATVEVIKGTRFLENTEKGYLYSVEVKFIGDQTSFRVFENTLSEISAKGGK